MTSVYVLSSVVVGGIIGFLLHNFLYLGKWTALMTEKEVLENKVSGLKEQMAQLKDWHEQQMAQQATLIKEQINSASENILKKRAEELSVTNKHQLSEILTPLQENLKQMKEAVEKSDREQISKIDRLDASIALNMKQAQEVGAQADRLAEALTSENKTQGNFGELRLRTLLENMGMQEGIQFDEQTVLKDSTGKTITDDETGKRMIPDVILHFPDKRDVVIDSKMSLKAFTDYCNADNDERKKAALKEHIASMRKHVTELATKNYNRSVGNGREKPDFVLMYVFSESALQLALSEDSDLWKDAYDKNVIITGSQNLFMMLRILEMSWRQYHQVENQAEIMKTADELVNRVQLFYERMQNVEKRFNDVNTAFEQLNLSISPEGRSIITAANKLIKFGAKENEKRKASIKGEVGFES